MRLSKRAQSIIEFSMIIALVVAGVILMRPYVLRSIGAYFHSADYSAYQAIKEPIREAGEHEFYPPGGNVCGDGVCVHGIEDVLGPMYCCYDCGSCGDTVCCEETDENVRLPGLFCAADCCPDGNCNNDGVMCDEWCGENVTTCPHDCWRCNDGWCTLPYEDFCQCAQEAGLPDEGNDCFCRDYGMLNNLGHDPDGCNSCMGEDPANCPFQCGAAINCGDGSCDAGENIWNCPEDCVGFCEDGFCNDNPQVGWASHGATNPDTGKPYKEHADATGCFNAVDKPDAVFCCEDCGYCGDGYCCGCGIGGDNTPESIGNCREDCKGTGMYGKECGCYDVDGSDGSGPCPTGLGCIRKWHWIAEGCSSGWQCEYYSDCDERHHSCDYCKQELLCRMYGDFGEVCYDYCCSEPTSFNDCTTVHYYHTPWYGPGDPCLKGHIHQSLNYDAHPCGSRDQNECCAGNCCSRVCDNRGNCSCIEWQGTCQIIDCPDEGKTCTAHFDCCPDAILADYICKKQNPDDNIDVDGGICAAGVEGETCGDWICDHPGVGGVETAINCPVDCLNEPAASFTCPGLGCEEALGENCANCPGDCGGPCCGRDGDGDGNRCDAGLGETAGNCPEDCLGSCGDGVCNSTYYIIPSREHVGANYCADDCGGATCPNGTCDDGSAGPDLGEDACNCPDDCPQQCPDGCCDNLRGEDCCSCGQDCGILGSPPGHPCCGNGNCDCLEDAASCYVDCHCGDGSCQIGDGENLMNCPIDCSYLCGDGGCCPDDHGGAFDCSYGGTIAIDHGESCSNCPADCGSCPVFK